MTKLASRLPDNNGLHAIADRLVDRPQETHVVIGVVDCAKITRDLTKGDVEPTARIRSIEVLAPIDTDQGEKLIRRAYDRRNGATTLPIHVEDQLTRAFTVRAEDVATDLAADTTHLDPDQAKALAASLDQPLRREVARALGVLRDSKEWVTLGRARRVLQLALQQLEWADLHLLRDEEGRLIDPHTGEIITDEVQLTSEDVDRLLAAHDEVEAEKGDDDTENEDPDEGDGDEPA